MFNTLRYQDELRDSERHRAAAGGPKSAGVTPKEVDLAKRLVDDMTEQWDPAQYKNTYHDDLMARIEEKIKAGPDDRRSPSPRRTSGAAQRAGDRPCRPPEAEPRQGRPVAQERRTRARRDAKRKPRVEAQRSRRQARRPRATRRKRA